MLEGKKSMKYLVSRMPGYLSLALAVYLGYVAYGALDAYQDLRLSASVFSTLAGTLFGFLITSLSMLIAIADREFIKRIRATGHYAFLIHKMFCVAGFLLASAVAGTLVQIVSSCEWQKMAIAISVSLFYYAIYMFLMVGLKFKKIVGFLAK